MLAAQGIVIIIGGAVSIYAVRSLSKVAWGEYSTALALIGLFTVIAGLGIAQLALREMTEEPARRQLVLSRALGTLLLTSVVAVALMPVVALSLGYRDRILVLIVVLAPLVLLDSASALAYSAFNAQRTLVYSAAHQLVRSVVYGVAAVTAFTLGAGVFGLAAALVAGTASGVVVAGFLLKARAGLVPVPGLVGVRTFVRASVPLAAISLVGIFYDQLDVLMLSLLGDATAVASYVVPYNLVKLSWVLPSIVGGVFFPVFSLKLGVRSSDEAERLFFLTMRLFLLASVPVSLFLAIGSHSLVTGLFGLRYANSSAILQVMAWTCALSFQNYLLWYGLLAIRRERIVLGIQVAGLALNAALNVALIPSFHAMGAAISFVACEAFVVLGQGFVVNRYLFRVPLWTILAKPLGAALVVVPAAIAAALWSPVAAAVASAAAYPLLLVVSGYISRAEWRPLTEALRGIGTRLRNPAPGKGGGSAAL